MKFNGSSLVGLLLLSLGAINVCYGHELNEIVNSDLVPKLRGELDDDDDVHYRNLKGKCKLTIKQTEGPYFTANSPLKSDFTSDITVTDSMEEIVVYGKVLDVGCNPIVGALVDFWHADPNGVYDNSGYKFRGHQLTDSSGSFSLKTLMPGEYPGRTEHIHFKVHTPSDAKPDASAVLTSQFYFPKQASNKEDGIFSKKLLVKVEKGDSTKMRFNMVIDI